MSDAEPEPPVVTRSGVPRALLVVIALIGGVAIGTRWHDVFGQWLPSRSDAPAAADASSDAQLWTCGMHPQVIQDHPGQCPICHMELTPLEASGEAGDSTITIDPVVVQNMGVQTTVVREAELVRTLRLFGTIEEAESSVHEVNLLVSGRIRRLYADTTGMHVEKHAPLFELFSPELSAAIEETIRLRRAAPSGAGGDGSATGRQSLYHAALRRLELLGLSSAQAERLSKLDRAPRGVTFTSPIAGVVTDKEIVEGAAVTAGQRALRVVDHETVWLDARMFESDIGAVAIGEAITATVGALPGESFTGKVVFVAPHLDPVTRTMLVRLELDNRELRLRPGMFASSVLEVAAATRTAVVPREAIIDTGTRSVAFVSLGEGRFEPRLVATGLEDGTGEIQVLAGLQAGELVVTRGQFLLDSESRLREAVQKFLGQRQEPVAAPVVTEPTITPPVTRPKPAASSRPRASRPTRPAASPPTKPEPAPPDPPASEPVDYTCPMHPQVHRDAPGSCPICKMDLVPSKGAR